MKKKTSSRILITCAGGSASVYLARQLAKRHTVFLADADRLNVAPYLEFPFQTIPFGNAPTFSSALRRLIRKHRITCIVPGADEELIPVSRLRASLPGLKAILPTEPFIRTCLNKRTLMKTLDRRGISHLLPYASVGAVRYPAIVKPVFGRGSRQVHTVNRRSELNGYLDLYGKRFSDVLVQPAIAGEEYTVSVIVNNRNQLIGIVPKRILLKRGITQAAVAESQPAIERVCREIVARLKPCGPFNVQLKLWKKRVYIFEINPRLSTTVVLTDKAFGNEVDLYLEAFDRDHLRPSRPMRKGILLFRYVENIFPNHLS